MRSARSGCSRPKPSSKSRSKVRHGFSPRSAVGRRSRRVSGSVSSRVLQTNPGEGRRRRSPRRPLPPRRNRIMRSPPHRNPKSRAVPHLARRLCRQRLFPRRFRKNPLRRLASRGTVLRPRRRSRASLERRRRKLAGGRGARPVPSSAASGRVHRRAGGADAGKFARRRASGKPAAGLSDASDTSKRFTPPGKTDTRKPGSKPRAETTRRSKDGGGPPRRGKR